MPHANIHYKRDLAGELLQWIYGPLKPRNRAEPRGRFVHVDQTRCLPDATLHGLGATGQLYVPSHCEAGKPCRLHVALHGCQQDRSRH